MPFYQRPAHGLFCEIPATAVLLRYRFTSALHTASSAKKVSRDFHRIDGASAEKMQLLHLDQFIFACTHSQICGGFNGMDAITAVDPFHEMITPRIV